MSHVKSLFKVLEGEIAKISHVSLEQEDMSDLLRKAIKTTLLEIKESRADVDDFYDSTVLNVIHLGAQEGYSTDEIREFIQEFKGSPGVIVNTDE